MKMQRVYTSPSTVTISTSNILSILPPRAPEARAQSGQESETLCGSLAVVSTLDLIEWLCSNKKIWLLRLYRQGQGKGILGEVVVIDGQIVDARWGDVHGMPALSEIVGCQKGSFDLAPVSGSVERTLHGHWQSLLLSAVQILDERNHQSRDSLPLAKAGKDNRQHPEALIDQGFAALRAGNSAEARQRWTEALALDPDNRSVQFNLRKLDSAS
jgi:hypothetical protein